VTALRLAEQRGDEVEHFDLWVMLAGAQRPSASAPGSGQTASACTASARLWSASTRSARGTCTTRPARPPHHAPLAPPARGALPRDRRGRRPGRHLRRATAGRARANRSDPRVGYPPSRSAARAPPSRPRGSIAPSWFCRELIERLDAEVGPQLEANAEALGRGRTSEPRVRRSRYVPV
jgi:hypothetical protein